MSTDRLEQLKMEGVERSVQHGLISTGESFVCYFGNMRSGWGANLIEAGALPAERKEFKVFGSKGSGKLACWQALQYLWEDEGHQICIYLSSDLEKLLPEVNPIRELDLAPVSVETERLKSQEIATYRAWLADRKAAHRLAVENARLREITKTLQRALRIQASAEIKLRETHMGTVSEVLGDQVEVTYETNEGPLKQIYGKKQFVQGELPKEGDMIEAHVMIAVVKDRMEKPKKTEFVSDLPSFGDKAEPGPIRL